MIGWTSEHVVYTFTPVLYYNIISPHQYYIYSFFILYHIVSIKLRLIFVVCSTH